MAVTVFAGVPGTTYTATGMHSATAIMDDYIDDGTLGPRFQNQWVYYDYYNFGLYEGAPAQYEGSYEWFGPGPEQRRLSSVIHTGNTTAMGTPPQIPTSLKFLSVTVLPTGTTGNSGCTPTTGDYGIGLDIKYQVLDQAGKPILQSGMTPLEIVQGVQGVTGPQPIGPTGNSNSSATTASDGTFHDVPFLMCSMGPFSNANILQIIYINSTSQKVRQNSFTGSSSAAGHGSISNGNDVSASR